MGSRFHPREYPPKDIYVAEFEMAHAPVTVNQYAVFLNSGASKQKKWWEPDGWAWLQEKSDGWGREDRTQPDRWKLQLQRPHHPVVGITWFEAQAYCAWVSDERKLNVSLPTEEQWERAARGDDKRPFPWGEEFDREKTNTLEGGDEDTGLAASEAGDVSPFGVLGLGGNVQEWTTSEYTPLEDEARPSDIIRVARGGTFNDTAFGARTSYRRGYPPGYFYAFLGFRVVVGIK